MSLNNKDKSVPNLGVKKVRQLRTLKVYCRYSGSGDWHQEVPRKLVYGQMQTDQVTDRA